MPTLNRWKLSSLSRQAMRSMKVAFWQKGTVHKMPRTATNSMADSLQSKFESESTDTPPKHPYLGLPDRQFWKKEPGLAQPDTFDPVSPPLFRILRTTPVVTAGSCFAQHVARHMTAQGYNHLIEEKAHPLFDEGLSSEFNYGLFSARYGNIYTTRQLNQTLQRAFGSYHPIQNAWRRGGRFVDPFRPQIHPNGFSSEAELNEDRRRHLGAIRRAVQKMEVFVFTLGLTEAWVDRRDGAVFPIAPGVAGGVYDPSLVSFHNFNLTETISDLKAALRFIRGQNPGVKIILTVSPVSLNATMEDQHVAVATAYSKSVLRIAAQEMADTVSDCVYFPSYELITSPVTRSSYFAEDGRSVLEAGVEHVMRLFFHHSGVGSAHTTLSPPLIDEANLRTQNHVSKMSQVIDALCDEEALRND